MLRRIRLDLKDPLKMFYHGDLVEELKAKKTDKMN
jgi:hypothetical protein